MRKLSIALCVLVAAALYACGGGNNNSSGSTGGTGSSGSTAGSGSSGGSTGGMINGCSVIGIFDSTFQTNHGPGHGKSTVRADGTFTQIVALSYPDGGGLDDAGIGGVTTTIDGNYTISGNDITFNNIDGSSNTGATVDYCPNQPGVYGVSWSTDCNQLTLTLVSDTCQERIHEANGTPLIRE